MEPPPPAQRPQHPLANYQFSPEELKILRECNVESFFQRSMPLGIAFGVSAFLGVKQGYLKPNAKYGAVPKIIAGVVVGYFMGKFSYQSKCAEKLMRLPDSKLAEALRQRKQSGVIGSLKPDQAGLGLALAPFTPSMSDIYSDEKEYRGDRSTVLNLDTESRPTILGLDDIYRPSLDNTPPNQEPELPLESVKPGTSYEELRKQNREEYLKKQQSPFAQTLPSNVPVVMRQKEASKAYAGEQDITTHKQTNKYGDNWSD